MSSYEWAIDSDNKNDFDWQDAKERLKEGLKNLPPTWATLYIPQRSASEMTMEIIKL